MMFMGVMSASRTFSFAFLNALPRSEPEKSSFNISLPVFSLYVEPTEESHESPPLLMNINENRLFASDE